jgi:hypothetical protein
MPEPQNTDRSERENRPGKTRTWWHPLLARLLDYELATAYAVRDEVLVGKLPLRVDILLIRREAGQLSEVGRRDLSVLMPLLNRFTLIEFKGPTDTLEPGDLAQLVGCAFLWHGQQAERVPQADISLIVLAPSVNEAIRDELRCLEWQISEHEAGVHRITGGPFTLWLIETDVMAKRGQPVLSLVSRVFLKEHERIIEQLMRTGHGMLLCYTLQQIEQFRSLGEEFAMQHADTEYLEEVEDELQKVLNTISVEKRLRGLPAEERLRGLPAEERLRGLSSEEVLRRFTPGEVLGRFTPEELAGGLSDEQAERLRELLEQKRGK